MVDFSVRLDELHRAADHLAEAAGVAAKARDELARPRLSGEGEPFGDTLRMPDVARAYERHRERMERLLAELDENTWATGQALRRVAGLYEESDQSARARLHAILADLDTL